MARKFRNASSVPDKQPELNLESEEIEIPQVETVESVPEVETKADPEAIAAEEGIDVLRERLQRAKERLAEEQQARLQAEQMVNRANVEVKDSQMHLVTNAIDTLNRDRETIKYNIRELMAAGDYDRAVDFQEMLAINNNKLMELEAGLEQMKKQAAAPQRQAPPEPHQLVDNLINQVSPRSARWLDRNRDHLTNVKALRVMERAHGDALDNEIEPDSDEYFRFIENRLGIGKQQQYQEPKQTDYDNEPVMSSASESVKRRTAPPAAPVSRSAPGTTSNQRGVRLTPQQREAAEISGLSEEDYYKFVLQERERQTAH